MPKYIGNCADRIDWPVVIDSIKDKTPDYEFADPVDHNPAMSADENERVARLQHSAMLDALNANLTKKVSAEYAAKRVALAQAVTQNWYDAGIQMSRISWETYHPRHFDDKVVPILTDFLDLKELLNFSIVKLAPGMVAPWHRDVAPDYYNQPVVRWVIFVHPPTPGHTLSFNNVTYWNEAVGNVYQWESHEAWHCAANASLVPYWTAHVEGIPK
jgi:hypothetical protein